MRGRESWEHGIMGKRNCRRRKFWVKEIVGKGNCEKEEL